MFVLTNAHLTLRRHRWRTLFIVIIAAATVFGTVFAQAVITENGRARGAGADAVHPTAVIRPTAKTLAKHSGADSARTKDYVSFSQYNAYASYLQQEGLQPQFVFTESLPMRQTGSVKAIAGKADQSADKTGGEYNVVALYDGSSIDINQAGRFKVRQGKQLNFKKPGKSDALVSQSLAAKNHLKVGSKFTVANPNNAGKTYQLKVSGIYSYTDPAPQGQGDSAKLAKENRDNAIYTGATFPVFSESLGDDGNSTASGWANPQFDIGFTFQNMDEYKTFKSGLRQMKLPAKYAVSSPTLDRYYASIAPLNDLAGKMKHVQVVAYVLGGLLMLVLVTLSLTRRSDEIHMGLLVGSTRPRLGAQMMLETLMPSLIGLVIGGLLTLPCTAPLGKALADGHKIPVSSDCWMPVWYAVGAVAVLAVISFLRPVVSKTSALFDARDSQESAGMTGSATVDNSERDDAVEAADTSHKGKDEGESGRE